MEEAKVYHPKLALAKLQPAPLQTKCVYRKRLLDTLIDKESSVKVVLVQAPAGYGKSILLTQYWQYCQSIEAKTLWLTIDNADNDIERLVRHLYASWETDQNSSLNTNLDISLESSANTSSSPFSDDAFANY